MPSASQIHNYEEPEVPAIDERLFNSAIDAWSTNTLAGRTQEDSAAAAQRGADISNISPTTGEPLAPIDRATPAAIIANNRDQANGVTQQPGNRFLTEDLRNHLNAENVPHGVFTVELKNRASDASSISHGNKLISQHTGVRFKVKDDEGNERLMSVNPEIMRLDPSAPLVEPWDEHVDRLRGLGLSVKAKNAHIDRSMRQRTHPQYAERGTGALTNPDHPSFDSFGYIKPAHMVQGRRSAAFHSATGIPQDVDDIDLNPKQGYKKWG